MHQFCGGLKLFYGVIRFISVRGWTVRRMMSLKGSAFQYQIIYGNQSSYKPNQEIYITVIKIKVREVKQKQLNNTLKPQYVLFQFIADFRGIIFNIMSESNLKPLASYPPLPGIKNISSPKSPPIPKSSREPRIIRTGSQSKIPTKVSSDKSIRQKQIEKQLRYAKPHINENQIQNSFNHSETNPVSAFFGAPFEDSQQTIQKFKSYSREKVIYGRHLGDDLVKGEVGKAFDILSGASGRSMKKSRVDGQDYYLYWKNKAHEYLDTNMKYMQDIRKLTRQNDQLKEKIGKIQKTNKVKKQQPKVISDEQTNQELRKISLHYLKKIDDMEKELKKKQISIHSYQIKLTDLSSRLAGDNERIKLMKKMKDELQRLQSANSQKRYEQPTNYNTLKLATSNSLTSTIMSPKTFTPSITTPNGFRSYSRKGMQF